MSNTKITNVHITDIRTGDTIEHNGVIMTVCGRDIKHDAFMGTTIFGDSYHSGHRLVKRVTFVTTKA